MKRVIAFLLQGATLAALAASPLIAAEPRPPERYWPTVVRHTGRFFLMGSGSEIHESESPLGPFRPVGALKIPFGQGKLPVMIDPMLFCDDDGRLFFYRGCTPSGGVWGVELEATNITNPKANRARLMVLGHPEGIQPGVAEFTVFGPVR